jgi:hypothetical protein
MTGHKETEPEHVERICANVVLRATPDKIRQYKREATKGEAEAALSALKIGFAYFESAKSKSILPPWQAARKWLESAATTFDVARHLGNKIVRFLARIYPQTNITIICIEWLATC